MTQPDSLLGNRQWLSSALLALSAAAVLLRIYGASTDQILNGELYRITTALLLHADGLHLASRLHGDAGFEFGGKTPSCSSF